jgi:hypothetical protein
MLPRLPEGETLLSRVGTAAVVGGVSLLPFLQGVLSGRSFYFRDLSLHFFPLRRYAVEGLRGLELRFWNPYVHEGVPLTVPTLSYPLDLLQALLPDERGFSLLLALHVPLAALAFLALARGLGLSRPAAGGASIVYALGGFSLSTLNLYAYLLAVAWAPLVILALLRASQGSPRQVAGAGLLVALILSTTALEVVAQAFLFALVLAASSRPRPGWLRMGSALILGGGLAAPTLLLMNDLMKGSARGAGFPVDVVLAHSIHPLTLLQVVVGDLYGDLGNLVNRWWGQNFFPLGFPYLLSLYLGLATLCAAAVGALCGRVYRGRILVLAALALVASLGRWGGLRLLVEAVPVLQRGRYPCKAFFTVHLAVALLAALGLEALARGERRAWRLLAGLAGGLGVAFVALPALPWARPEWARWFLSGFFPPDYAWALRLDRLRLILQDAAVGGSVSLAAGLLAVLVLTGRLAPRKGVLAAGALIAADLLRTGAGLNPMVTPAFYEPSAEVAALAPLLRAGGRLFTCNVGESPAYSRARAERPGDHEVWTFSTLRDTLTPNFNLRLLVPTAYSPDLTMSVPVDRAFSPQTEGCLFLPGILDRLREAGVTHVLSLDPLEHPELEPRAQLAPEAIRPLEIHLYAVKDPLPLRFVARGVHPANTREEAEQWAHGPGLLSGGAVAVEGSALDTSQAEGRILSLQESSDQIVMDAEADHPTMVVVRDGYAPGWTATVAGSSVPVLRANGRYRAVAIPAGRSQVVMSYRPPSLRRGLGVGLAAALVMAFLGWRPSSSRPVG